jgi:hypothetical protein
MARLVQLFEKTLVGVLDSRTGPQVSRAEIRALTLMALSWLDAAVRTYLLDNKPSLVKCFDEVVTACLRTTARDLAPTLATASTSDKGTRRVR